ncbi:hypothetical protein [Vreelandella glaciei]|uniref:hypothetical protein n=1 Tax=Vreelandella glaciei TaxID=186761 RepID=UPI003002A41E
MNYEAFKKRLEVKPIVIQVRELPNGPINNLDNEALFQLPFIAMVILVMAKGSTKPSVTELGSLVGECLEKSMPAFKRSNQHIAWSANLRVRTVKAMTFLEMAGLVEVQHNKGMVIISDLGRKVVSKAIDEDSELSLNLKNISRQYRNIYKDNKLELRLN